LLIEEALNCVPVKAKTIMTPTKTEFSGAEFEGEICAVSILRSGESMERVLRDVCKKIKIGKILIQRDEKTAEARLFFSKLPKDISQRYVLLLDPMLATGGSVCKAIDVLKEQKVREDRVIFINLISCPQGIEKVTSSFPGVKIITGYIDDGLNKNKYIVPGIGDFGDRYFGTD
jgi:uracil phosphoribosyltransferase